MYIFLDESGVFKAENTKLDQWDARCVASVVMTEDTLKLWEKNYGSVDKASKMSDEEAQEIITFFYKNDVQAFVVWTNLKAQVSNEVEKFRDEYIADRLAITINHPTFLRASVESHMKHLKDAHLQEATKAVLYISLIENTIRGLVEKHCMYSIQELQNPAWFCDEIDQEIMPVVKYLWALDLKAHSETWPLLATTSFKKRGKCFLNTSNPSLLDATKMLQNLSFAKDEMILGLKAADCLVNFYRRYLLNKLTLKKPYHLEKLFKLPYSQDMRALDHSRDLILNTPPNHLERCKRLGLQNKKRMEFFEKIRG